MTDPASSAAEAPPSQAATAANPLELAARLAAKLCHDFISPTSALVSGLDLLDDPDAADMREEALKLIAASGRKLEAYLVFYRVAFGGSQATESFDARELEKLSLGRFEQGRSELDWAVALPALDKIPARVLLNLIELGVAALPMGGVARIEARDVGEGVELSLRAEHARARLHPDTLGGLAGEPMGEGLSGRWVQPFFLHETVRQAGGNLRVSTEEGLVAVAVSLPRAAA